MASVAPFIPPHPADPRGSFQPLSPGRTLALAVTAVATFHAGFLVPTLGWLVLVWMGCLFALRRVPCGRWAFYVGLVIGLGTYGPQLAFFWTIFGPAAIALWLVLSFWLGCFLLVLHGVERYWGGSWAVGLSPVLWLGVEFFRSELYYLRFSWFTAGSFLPPEVTWPLLPVLGVYGLGALLALGAAWIARRFESRPVFSLPRWRTVAALTGLAAVGFFIAFLLSSPRLSPPTDLPVAGLQLEFPGPAEVIDHLRRLDRSHPEARVVVLSEYAFDGPVPDGIREWCRETRRWLIAGGKEPVEGGGFYNTAYVVSTNGEVVFQQAKSVPIQFFQDGLPAPDQRVWNSPWGRLGICICYDLNYTRVVDELIRLGATALIVPTMDVESWGRHEHRLNARLAPIRAAEHRVPLLRVASSGFSQLIDRQGGVKATTSMPGQGEILAGALRLDPTTRAALPWDRVLGPVAAGVGGVIALLLLRAQYRRRPAVHPFPQSTPQPISP